jgi:hypothetical protein
MTNARSTQVLAITLTMIGFAATALLVGCGGQTFGVEEGSSNFGQAVTYNTEVDVLWVIDTSGSMAKRQVEVAKQIPAFIAGLNATGLDYHIGVTTMDMSGSGAKGKLIAQTGTPLVLTKTTPNLVNILAGRVQPGENGSPVERGREALMAALSMSATDKVNAGFLRTNSLLNVIFVSDEEDESDNSINYVASLDAIKPVLPLGDRSWVAHFVGVVPNDATCKTAEWGFSSPGVRYIDLANASGGATESICDADFRRALTNVRSRVLEMLTEFPLDRNPIVASIKVVVDGVVIPNDETNGWTYRAAANAIRFHGAAIPKAGSRISVTFDPDGLK